MLTLESPLTLPSGRTIYRDVHDPRQFYYLPNERARVADGGRGLSFVVYTEDITGLPDFSLGEDRAGGFLTLEVELGPGPDEVAALLNELGSAVGGDCQLSQVPFTAGTVTLYLLSQTGTASGSGRTGFEVSVAGSTKPSLFGRQTAVFSVRLGGKAANILWETLRRSADPQAVVCYDFEFLAMQPAYNLEVTIDFKQTFEYTRHRIGLNALVAAVDLDILTQEMINEGHITIREMDYTGQGNAQSPVAGEGGVLRLVRDLMSPSLFNTVPIPTPEYRALPDSATQALSTAGGTRAFLGSGDSTPRAPMVAGSDLKITHTPLAATQAPGGAVEVSALVEPAAGVSGTQVKLLWRRAGSGSFTELPMQQGSRPTTGTGTGGGGAPGPGTGMPAGGGGPAPGPRSAPAGVRTEARGSSPVPSDTVPTGGGGGTTGGGTTGGGTTGGGTTGGGTTGGGTTGGGTTGGGPTGGGPTGGGTTGGGTTGGGTTGGGTTGGGTTGGGTTGGGTTGGGTTGGGTTGGGTTGGGTTGGGTTGGGTTGGGTTGGGTTGGGTTGSGSTGPGLPYTAQIPGQPSGTTIEYLIRATGTKAGAAVTQTLPEAGEREPLKFSAGVAAGAGTGTTVRPPVTDGPLLGYSLQNIDITQQVKRSFVLNKSQAVTQRYHPSGALSSDDIGPDFDAARQITRVALGDGPFRVIVLKVQAGFDFDKYFVKTATVRVEYGKRPDGSPVHALSATLSKDRPAAQLQFFADEAGTQHYDYWVEFACDADRVIGATPGQMLSSPVFRGVTSRSITVDLDAHSPLIPVEVQPGVLSFDPAPHQGLIRQVQVRVSATPGGEGRVITLAAGSTGDRVMVLPASPAARSFHLQETFFFRDGVTRIDRANVADTQVIVNEPADLVFKMIPVFVDPSALVKEVLVDAVYRHATGQEERATLHLNGTTPRSEFAVLLGPNDPKEWDATLRFVMHAGDPLEGRPQHLRVSEPLVHLKNAGFRVVSVALLDDTAFTANPDLLGIKVSFGANVDDETLPALSTMLRPSRTSASLVVPGVTAEAPVSVAIQFLRRNQPPQRIRQTLTAFEQELYIQT